MWSLINAEIETVKYEIYQVTDKQLVKKPLMFDSIFKTETKF